MGNITEKEKKQLKEWIKNESPFRNKKHDKYEPGLTIGDIARESGHSDRKEVIDISNEMVNERS